MTAIRPPFLPAMLPRRSALWRHVAPGDFLDCRAVASPFTMREAARRGLVHILHAPARMAGHAVAPEPPGA